MATREEQRREHNEQKELESLRRVFESLDKNKDGKVDFKELNDQLIKLDYRAKRVEVEDMIWEVDEDCDHCVSWDEFKLMFHRCRSDKVNPCALVCPATVAAWASLAPAFSHCTVFSRWQTGLEPRKLYNVVEFMMHDKDSSGSIDMDECMEILFRRFGKDQLEQRTNDFFKHDTDGDNAISFAEFQKQMQAIRPNRRDQQKTSKSTTSTTSITSLSNKGGPGMKKR